MHLQENTLFDLDIKVTQNIAQHPLHHVTYAPVNFEVATTNGLGLKKKKTGIITMQRVNKGVFFFTLENF